MVNLEEMEKTTDAIIKARRALAEAKEQVIAALWELKKQQHELYLEGVVVGKNEKERDACIWGATAAFQKAVADAERRERAAILALEICKDLRRHLENIISVELCKEEA